MGTMQELVQVAATERKATESSPYLFITFTESRFHDFLFRGAEERVTQGFVLEPVGRRDLFLLGPDDRAACHYRPVTKECEQPEGLYDKADVLRGMGAEIERETREDALCKHVGELVDVGLAAFWVV